MAIASSSFSSSSSALHQQLIRLFSSPAGYKPSYSIFSITCLILLSVFFLRISEPVRRLLSETSYTPPEHPNPSFKPLLQSLLPTSILSPDDVDLSENQQFINCSLCFALLASTSSYSSDSLNWIPAALSDAAETAFREILELRGGFEELMGEVVPLLKERIKESCVGDDEKDVVSAASGRAPLSFAVVAAHQFRWLVTQVQYPLIGKLCSLFIPCALTALDHWSPEVKGQGMISFIHMGKNMNATDFDFFQDVILDTCCQNIACSDEIWQYIVEMSVIFVTCSQQGNPRSAWFERLLNEMLSHLERQPRNKERRIAWLDLVEPLLSSMGLVLLAHFRRIFPLLFQWLHADDDRTVVLVLKQVRTIMNMTWIRNTHYATRLVDELVSLYKESAFKKAREEIRKHIVQILTLLQQSKGMQFETAWEKHKDDPNLMSIHQFFCVKDAAEFSSDQRNEMEL